jgi:hypothetical protein
MPAPPDWDFLLTDLQGNVLGDIVGAAERAVTLGHKRLPTASFRVPLWHPQAGNLLSGDTLLQCWRRDAFGAKLVFNGPVQNVEEVGQALGQTLAVTAVGPFWRLSKRVVGQTKGGLYLPGPPAGDPPVQPVGNLADLAFQIVDIVNGQQYTGIKKGTVTDKAGIASGALTYPEGLKVASDMIQELAAGLNSFDWVVTPMVPQGPILNNFPTIGSLDLAPLIGVVRENAIFEYGTPRANVATYTRSLTRDALLNQAIVSVSGWPDGTAADLVIRDDVTSQTNRGLLTEVVNDAGVVDSTLRASIGDEHLKYRKNPRQIITFTPAMNARPYPFTDYNVGDWVRARAVVRGSLRFDANFRIWGATFKLDQNGNESLELQLVDDQ